ncbi:MAG TPA: DUF192 domain-containing protein, partial [Actinomycetota bacterium]|nr:DUF192 domain-containing protein [Actinomycetota bacterium]
AAGRVVIEAEVADDDAERARGLMGRRELARGRGMLFVWRDVSPRRFHMQNTLIPLDLVVIRSGRVVGTHTMVPCEADPCPVTETLAADAALELAAGSIRDLGIAPGDVVESPVLL